MVIHWLHAPFFTIQYPKPLFDLWVIGETMDKKI